MTFSASPGPRRSKRIGVIATGGLSVGAGFFATSSGELALLLLFAAIGFGFRYIVGRQE
jgi:hypothetical protein